MINSKVNLKLQDSKGPKLLDICRLKQAGINPKTGLPIRINDECQLKENIKRQLRVLDEQNAIRRFRWYNLPSGLTGELLERILYYKGKGMLFKIADKFYFLPYALNGELDCYGRYMGVTPIPFNGTAKEKEPKAWIPGLNRKPLYDMGEQITMDTFENGCVLLYDYTPQYSQNIVPRQILQESVLDAMAEAFPMARTNLISNSGIKGMRVNDEDQEATVKLASNSLQHAALTGNPWIPVVSNIEFQDLTSGGTALKSEEYLLYMQALDNYRLSLYGLKNGGLFQKKAHMLEAEQNMNDGTTLFAYQDSLDLRQQFCDRVNLIWGLGIYCEPAEQVIGVDRNDDGMIGDESDQSGTMEGEQPVMNEEAE